MASYALNTQTTCNFIFKEIQLHVAKKKITSNFPANMLIYLVAFNN